MLPHHTRRIVPLTSVEAFPPPNSPHDNANKPQNVKLSFFWSISPPVVSGDCYHGDMRNLISELAWGEVSWWYCQTHIRKIEKRKIITTSPTLRSQSLWNRPRVHFDLQTVLVAINGAENQPFFFFYRDESSRLYTTRTRNTACTNTSMRKNHSVCFLWCMERLSYRDNETDTFLLRYLHCVLKFPNNFLLGWTLLCLLLVCWRREG